jgi:AcrR family transcriptional regulator
MSTKQSNRGSARERLLSAANELFYGEGVHTVGIDRVIARAGVAKASLYSAFGSKDELIRSYLQGRQDLRRDRILARLAKHETARERILAVFELQAELAADPAFRGCAFLRASAEATPESGVREVCDDMRAWTRSLFVELSAEAGARDPSALAGQLVLLYDGSVVGAQMDRTASAAATALAVATVLIDAATRPATP